ncbi:GIY-YIG nuclease family protein [Trichormus azollae]|mgnify:FL=1|jgi:hypothetical protein|uniref:Nuclease subunit of the excinuclease complex n=1 Tax=Nostoc azollae (strain 0708) TaxID=551115 RepID=D7E2K2_NOSA0|nr:GIY-YIG nuclease family protein [Trichormus azollae]ADI63379.1 conserved hypothetical protein ['Nostoc azollae' 0708]
MTTETNLPTLASLEYVAYIDDVGELPEQFQGQIGVYAIFNHEKILQFVGYSRDVYLSLKQHLVRQPNECYWVKVQTIERPNRTLLENLANAWISENGPVRLATAENKENWIDPINTLLLMTDEEKTNYQNPLIDDLVKMKLVKNVARRVEAEILEVLKTRGLKTQIRFNPKLKEEGLLDLK